MTRHDVIVAGAGFAGIYAAWRLAKAGKKVALLESADHIGGNLQSRQWKNYWLDNGTHNFDIRTSLGQQFFLEILDGNLQIFEDQQWASTVADTWTYGFEQPDFSADDPTFAQAAVAQLAESRSADNGAKPRVDSYLDFYRQTYGELLADRTMPMIEKYTGSDPSQFAAAAGGLLSGFNRPKLGTDAEMVNLKNSAPFWNDRLGVTLNCGAEEFLGKNVNKRFAYPARKGLTGFCDAAFEKLRQLGVDIHLSCAVIGFQDTASDTVQVKTDRNLFEGRKLFWSLSDVLLAKILQLDVDLTQSAVPVGTCFFAYEVYTDSILGPDYLHDYAVNRLPFRYNAQGIYSQQTQSDGSVFVVAEVPCHPKNISSLLNQKSLEKCWKAMSEVGFLKTDTQLIDSTSWGHPVAYSIPKIGWQQAYERAKAQIANHSRNIVDIEFGYRGRWSFMSYFDSVLQHIL